MDRQYDALAAENNVVHEVYLRVQEDHQIYGAVEKPNCVAIKYPLQQVAVPLEILSDDRGLVEAGGIQVVDNLRFLLKLVINAGNQNCQKFDREHYIASIVRPYACNRVLDASVDANKGDELYIAVYPVGEVAHNCQN